MNFFTGDTAYSLFPKATFEEQRGLFTGARDDISYNEIQKYQERGWSYSEQISYEQQNDPNASLQYGRRALNDSRTWVLTLHPVLEPDSGHHANALRTTSFNITTDIKHLTPRIQHGTIYIISEDLQLNLGLELIEKSRLLLQKFVETSSSFDAAL